MEKTCFELSLTPSYVSNWTFCDAVRELIQNGIDQETVDSTNKFSMTYDEERKVIRFVNTKSRLHINTLLLGKTSKAKNDSTVGQFGEGYKIAALVLNRLGKTFTIYNNTKKELWESRFKNSEKWHDKLLAFYVSKNEPTENCFVIEVGNVEEDEYYDIQGVWINFEDTYDDIEKVSTSYGDIILDEDYANTVYVNGLAIDYNGDLHYGYNFKPQYIKLERDRKTCDSWNAKIVTSKMISEAMLSGEIEPEVVTKMVAEDTDDVYQMDIISENKGVQNALISEFDKNNQSPYSVPVETQEQFKRVKMLGGNPVIVPHRVASILKVETENRIQELASLPESYSLTLAQRFDRWISIYQDELSDEAVKEFNKLLDELKTGD